MGVDAVMRFTTKRPLGEAELRKLAWKLAGAFYRDETFWCGQYGEPEQAISKASESDLECADVPLQDGEHLYTVHLKGRYYGPDYERGNLPEIVAVAEWIEANLPEAALWYGGDSSDKLERFDLATRQQLKLHFWQHGHKPYVSAFGFDKGMVPPLCKLCREPMIESGGGGGNSFVFCYGCTAKAIVRNRDSAVLRYWMDGKDFFAVSDELRQEAQEVAS